MKNEDIKQQGTGELDWQGEARIASLSKEYQSVIAYALKAEDWYKKERQSKRYWGQGLRAGAIVLGGVAAVIPILAELSAADGGSSIAPGWSAVALAIAATLVALDRYFGFSVAWMRFMTAGQQIAALRHRFECEWQLVQSRAASPPTDDELRELLGLAHGLESAVDLEIERETNVWVAEFNSALEQIDREAGGQKRSRVEE